MSVKNPPRHSCCVRDSETFEFLEVGSATRMPSDRAKENNHVRDIPTNPNQNVFFCQESLIDYRAQLILRYAHTCVYIYIYL